MQRSISLPDDVVIVDAGSIEPLLTDLLSVVVRLCVRGVEVGVFWPKRENKSFFRLLFTYQVIYT